MFSISKSKILNFKNISFISKCFKNYKFIPNGPTWKPQFYPDQKLSNASVDFETVYLLERLSLIDFGTAKSVQVLVDAINFVSDMKLVDTKNVEPKSRIWDDAELWLRNEDDEQLNNELSDTMGNVNQITSNSEHIFEDYFTAPIGNKPIEKDESRAETYNIAQKSSS